MCRYNSISLLVKLFSVWRLPEKSFFGPPQNKFIMIFKWGCIFKIGLFFKPSLLKLLQLPDVWMWHTQTHTHTYIYTHKHKSSATDNFQMYPQVLSHLRGHHDPIFDDLQIIYKWRHFWLLKMRGGCYQPQVGRDQRCYYVPYRAQDGPRHKELCGPRCQQCRVWETVLGIGGIPFVQTAEFQSIGK